MGVPVGRMLGRKGVQRAADQQKAKGSIMVVLATDAPLSERNLRRVAARALIGVGRTGSVMDNGSGDYVIAFSTNRDVRRRSEELRRSGPDLANDAMSELFRRLRRPPSKRSTTLSSWRPPCALVTPRWRRFRSPRSGN